ncbi:MAG: hypothetical protein O7F71_05630 [Gammaproteobacteria bacterium]|nr:hypothetical protein [Gammaproteobacteria bacterium]
MKYWRSLVPLLLAISVAACSGESNQKTAGRNPAAAAPASVNLSASATVVAPGESVTLTWRAFNAEQCQSSGGWSGDKALSGSQTVANITQDTRFRLSCSGAGGGGLAEVMVSANSNGPNVTLRASPAQVAADGTSTLTWDSANTNTCTAGGGWSGTQPQSGNFTTGTLTEDTTYRLTCDGPGGSAVAIVTVRILSKTLRWQAPTQNVDGSPLTDLAGYIVYWGTQSRNYTGSHTINSPGITEWDATVAAGPYYFALTALDSEGNESGYSNQVLKTIP